MRTANENQMAKAPNTITATKHRTPSAWAPDMTLNRVSRAQQYLILNALMNEREKYTKDMSDEGHEKWLELSDIIGTILKAM